MARGGSPQLTFRQGRLAPDLAARVGTTEGAQSPSQVAQRDLGRYYALLAAGRMQLAARPEAAVRNAVLMAEEPLVQIWAKILTPLERAALDDLRERYYAAETVAAREAIIGEIVSTMNP